MGNLLFLICLIIVGIILGIIIYKKITKRFSVLIAHIAIIIILCIILCVMTISKPSGNMANFIFHFIIYIFPVLVVSLVVELILLIINKIKNKKIFQAISIMMIFPLIAILIYLTANIFSIAMKNPYDKEANNVKNWFRCKIRFGDWILHQGSFGGLYECGLGRTSDGGKECRTSDECELDCVEYNPASDYGTYGICQTHKRFLDNKTYRRKLEMP